MGSGVGGGLCQLSNLIYWMTLHTPLTVTERYRHSYDVFPDAERTLPFGSGATCYYNYLDLQISNLTEQPFQLQIALTESHLAGEWRANLPPT
ncbi:VanW family protein, partial [Microbacteriaceae bacterium K1510]|nr:VanW family protein [Microbacteriaceae bacterium K1510]